MVVKAESTASVLIETDEPLCVDPRPSYLNPDGPRGHRLPSPGLARRPQAASVRGFHFAQLRVDRRLLGGTSGACRQRPSQASMTDAVDDDAHYLRAKLCRGSPCLLSARFRDNR